VVGAGPDYHSPVPSPYRPVTDGVLSRLREVLLDEEVLRDEEQRQAYARDETEDLRFLPEVVVTPSSTAEVQEVLRIAHEERVPVTPRGAGTGLSGGALPTRGGIVLSCERLNTIREVDERDMVAEAEVGVVTDDLRRAVAERGLFYPPDPSSSDVCTLGGNLAEDAAGPRSLRYGSTRHHVLGLEAVLADGSLLRTGGRNRKDVAGYDLTQLLVGSEGTLAVITAAVLRLQPAPGETLSLLAPFDSLDAAAAAVEAVCRVTPRLLACELVEREAVETVARVTPVPDELRGAEAILFLELASEDEGALFEAASALEAVLRERGSGEVKAARQAADQRRLWEVRRRVGAAVKGRSVYKECDATVPRSRLAELVRAARETAAHHDLLALCYGHAGDGNLHVNLLRGDLDDETWSDRMAAAEEELFERVLAVGGTVTGEHGIGLTQRRFLERTRGPRAVEIMRGLKGVFDPRGILNPDKVLPDEVAR